MLLLLAAFCALAASPGPAFGASCKNADHAVKDLPKSQATRAIRCLVNKERGKSHVGKLAKNGDLNRVAQKHTGLMKRKGELSHQLKGEPSPEKRIAKSGYLDGYRSYGFAEDISLSTKRSASVKEIFDGLMASPPHRANILRTGLEHIGVGLAIKGDKVYFTLDFASRKH